MNRLLGLSALLLISACSTTTNSTLLTEKKYAPKKDDCAIKVYSSNPTDVKFEEIAILTARSQEFSSNTTLERILPHLKEEACKIGADGIVIKNAVDGSYTGVWTGTPVNQPASASATAIKFL
jgi:hypothetical protein